MKNLIFSIYIDIDINNLQNLMGYIGDDVSRSHRTKTKLAEYYSKLVECKQQYADKCGAEFKIFGADQEYKKFLESMQNDIYEFDKINFYKHYLLEKLSHDYDNVLYLDLDVVPNTTQSFFDSLDITKFCVHCADASRAATWGMMNGAVVRHLHCDLHNCTMTYEHAVEHHLDQYHWYIKKLCKDAMLMYDNLHDPKNLLANTAIMGGNSKAIQSVKFFDRMSYMLEVFENIVKENIMGSAITSKFFVNNEVFMTYLIQKWDLPCTFLPSQWHYIQLDEYTNHAEKSQSHLLHIIDKKFEKIWRKNVST